MSVIPFFQFFGVNFSNHWPTQFFVKGDSFQVHCLETGEEKSIDLPPLVEKKFDELSSDCFQTGTYAHPVSQRFPAFDSIGTDRIGPKAFQITVSIWIKQQGCICGTEVL
jgi:hypothetical protein